MNNPGRNDPCHCGSGKKYKKCCLPQEQPTLISDPRREESFIAELRPDLDEAVDRALQRLARGEGKQAESEIAELLEGEPFIPDSIRQVEFYADRLRAGPHSGSPDAMGV